MSETRFEAERKEILKRYRNLIRAIKPTTDAERKQIRKALNLAIDAHKNTRRKDGDPYIYHPLEVARISAEEIGLGTTSVICALLHDVVEDSDYKLDYIEAHFGKKVASIIDGLTKIEEMPEAHNPSKQAENYRKVIFTLSEDVRVILLKLADRLHNMRTIDAQSPSKQMKIAAETLYLYAPLALRLGLYAIKSELEDLSLHVTEPEIYATLSRKLKQNKVDREKFITEFIHPIREALTAKKMVHEIQAREKSIHSIWSKMKEKDIPFEEIYDLFAVRIIIESELKNEKVDCWRVYSIVTDRYRPQQSRLRDWVSTPKANGYESLHTTVMSHTGQWVEIQIRTRRMDDIAEKGYAAHWKYKDKNNGNGSEPTALDKYLIRIRDLLKSSESDSLIFLDDFKLSLFKDEIFVYTPKGDERTLPQKSTALDFAYAIHTEIGNTCIAAKVNHRLVPLHHELRNGDQVEIITSKKQKPREEWLKWVVTARARLQIKESLREQKKDFVSEGKQKLKELFRSTGVDMTRDNLTRLLEFCQFSGPLDLYYAVAKGEVTQREVKSCFTELSRSSLIGSILKPFSRSRAQENKSLSTMIREKVKSTPEALLLGDDISTVNYNLSPCCNPIPGDDVIGFLEPDRMITIHRTSCSEAIQLGSRFGDRIVKTKWKSTENISFLTGIRISGIDRQGLLLEIFKLTSEKHKANVKSFLLDSSGEFWQASLMLYVNDTNALNHIIRDLREIRDIKRVMRIDRMAEKSS